MNGSDASQLIRALFNLFEFLQLNLIYLNKV